MVEALRVIKTYRDSDGSEENGKETTSAALVTHGADIEEQLQGYVGATWVDGPITFKLLCVSTHTLRVKVGPGNKSKRQRNVIGSYADNAFYDALEEVPFNALQLSSAREVLNWVEEAEVGLTGVGKSLPRISISRRQSAFTVTLQMAAGMNLR